MTGAEDRLFDKDGKPRGTVATPFGNIDENGNVLFLDAQRLRRKERPNKRVYKAKSDPFGLLDRFANAVALRRWNYFLVERGFKTLRRGIALLAKVPGALRYYVKLTTLFAPESRTYTQGHVYNLNVDLEDDVQNVTLPIDFVREAVLNAEYIGGMKSCFCRDGFGCKEYPHDIGCLFLNGSGRAVVDHGLAVEFTKEEALARIDKGAELGLVCQALWVQVERFLWGLKTEKMNELLEICFCCPCCCAGLNLVAAGDRSIRQRFAPSGWTAVCDRSLCTGCRECADHCPQDAISFRESDGKQVIDQETCMGCGLCKARCPEGAILIKQTMPMRDNMHAYFLEEGRLDLK